MSTFAPLQLQNIVRSKVKYLLVGIFLALAASLFLAPGSASAADSYRWTDPETIRASVPGLGEQSDIASYGAERGSTVEFKRGLGPHTTESARKYVATVNKGNCQATLTLTVSADSKGSGSVVPSGCVIGGTLPGIGKTVSISNTDAAGDDSETVPVEVAGEEEEITCETSPEVTPALRFVACPALEATTSSIWLLDDLVTNLLNYDIRKLEDSAAHDAWRSFQIIAYSLVFIAGLVIVIGQAAGVQFLDAYTIKKALPRLIIAVIFIALSWEILLLFVAFMNQLGWWAQDLILEPFGENLKNMNAENAWIDGALAGGAVAGAATGLAGVLIYMATIGWAGVGLILLSWLIGVLIVFAVIAIRTIIITLGIVLAPLAIASMILPATQNLWELWRKAFITASTVFPLITALLAMGKVAGDIMGWPLLPLLYIAPYFLIPAVFKLAGGLVGRIAGMVNNPSRGLFDRMRNTRQGMYDKKKEDLVAGRVGGVRGTALGEVHRRSTLAHQGGLSISRSGRSRYAAAVQQMHTANRAKAVEEDAFFSTGDPDDARAAIAASSDGDFIKRRMAQGLSKDEAWQRLGRIKNAYGDINSNETKNAVTQALFADPTAFNPANNDYSASGRQSMYNDFVSTVRDMEARGVDRNTAINMLRANKARPEFASMGHSDWLGVLGRADQNVAAGGVAVDKNLATQMDNLALEQTDAYGVLRGNDRSIRAMANMRAERIKSFMRPNATTGQPELDLNDRAVQQEFAALNALHQQLSNASPQKGKIMADVLMSLQTGPTTQQREAVQNIQLQMQATPQGSPEYNVLAQRLTAAQNDLAHTSVRDHMRSVGENTNNAAYHEMVREYGSRFASEISAGEQASAAAAEARRQEEENH